MDLIHLLFNLCFKFDSDNYLDYKEEFNGQFNKYKENFFLHCPKVLVIR